MTSRVVPTAQAIATLPEWAQKHIYAQRNVITEANEVIRKHADTICQLERTQRDLDTENRRLRALVAGLKSDREAIPEYMHRSIFEAFARHRIAAIEECNQIALGYADMCDGTDDPSSVTAKHTAAAIAECIRALPSEEAIRRLTLVDPKE